MQKLLKGNIVKKIIIALVIVITCNFIIPVYSHAGVGGVLFEPIKVVVEALGDAVMSLINLSFTGKWIDVAGSRAQGTGDWKDYWSESWIGDGCLDWPTILITPEEIFSGKVLALNVNFLRKVDENNLEKLTDGTLVTNINRDNIIGSEGTASSINTLRSEIAKWYLMLRNLSVAALFCVLIYVGIRIVLSSASEEKAKYKSMIINWIVAICIVFVLHYIMSLVMFVTDSLVDVIRNNSNSSANYSNNITRLEGGVTEDFTLKKIGKVGGGSVEQTGTAEIHNLLEYVRLYVNAEKPDLACATYLFIYIILVVFTVMFIFKYLKRFMYMAFLTMIAPIVAFTYPLDKMGDGSAQAFNKWFTEYLFNALLQPLHLLIYVVLVGLAADLARTNFVYTIAALAFINQSEKLLKEFFGLNRASTTGGSGGAFAAGALASNAINAFRKGTSGGGDKSLPSGGSGNSGGSAGTSGGSKPRQARGLDAYSSDSSSSGSSRNTLPENNHQEEPRWHPGLSQEQKDELQSEGLKPGDQEYNQYLRSNGLNLIDPPKDSDNSQDTAKPLDEARNVKLQNNNTKNEKFKNGRLKSLGKAAWRNAKYTGPKIGKSLARGTIRTAGAVTGGIIGGAMAVATGDAKYLAGGIAGGAALGGKAVNIASKVPSSAKKIRTAYRQERLGSDVVASKARVEEFLKNKDNIKYFQEKYNFDSEKDVKNYLKKNGSEFIGAGYTDVEDVDRLMKMQQTIGSSPDQAMFTDNMASQMKTEDLIDPDKSAKIQEKFAYQIRANSGKKISEAKANELAQKHIEGMKISKGLASSNLRITEAERNSKGTKKQEKQQNKQAKRQEKQQIKQTTRQQENQQTKTKTPLPRRTKNK